MQFSRMENGHMENRHVGSGHKGSHDLFCGNNLHLLHCNSVLLHPPPLGWMKLLVSFWIISWAFVSCHSHKKTLYRRRLLKLDWFFVRHCLKQSIKTAYTNSYTALLICNRKLMFTPIIQWTTTCLFTLNMINE